MSAAELDHSAHDRLLRAVSEVVGREGCSCLTVERLLAAAGVGRATFYQYFANADDCLWDAYRHHARGVVSEIASAIAGGGPPEHAVLEALCDIALSRPDVAQLLMCECLAAGAAGLRERDALIAGIEGAIAASPSVECRVDLPGNVLIGGAFRALSMQFADASVDRSLREDLLRWAAAFAQPRGHPRWSPLLTPAPAEEPVRPFMDAHRARSQGKPRERILHATAATIRKKGYRASTVADIVDAARVSRRSFYNEFSGKAPAVVAVYEHAFQQCLAACAPAFFNATEWPERVWQSALAFTSFFAREPHFAHLGFVECYALGRDFAARVRDTQLAFTLFLEEGYRQRPDAQRLPRAYSTITAAVIAEAGFLASRSAPSSYLRRMQPLAVYTALTPFIGVEQAGKFVTGKLAATTTVRAPAAAQAQTRQAATTLA